MTPRPVSRGPRACSIAEMIFAQCYAVSARLHNPEPAILAAKHVIESGKRLISRPGAGQMTTPTSRNTHNMSTLHR